MIFGLRTLLLRLALFCSTFSSCFFMMLSLKSLGRALARVVLLLFFPAPLPFVLFLPMAPPPGEKADGLMRL